VGQWRYGEAFDKDRFGKLVEAFEKTLENLKAKAADLTQ
jgi:hypothetical protein